MQTDIQSETMEDRKLSFVESCIMATLSFFIFGLVCMWLYRWLIVPVYGMEPLTHGQAMAVGFVVAYLTKSVSPFTDNSAAKTWQSFGYDLGRQVVVVLCGFVLSFLV